MNHFDAIVIGQGPGGAAAGFEMARRGLKVLAFAGPFQSKACGGCLSARWRYLFDFLKAPDWMWQHPVNHIILDAPGQSPVPWSTERTAAFLVDRNRMDQWLMEKSRLAGVKVIEAKADQIQKTGQGFLIKADGAEYTADWLIGAEGALSLSKRQLDFAQRNHTFTALVEERPLSPELARKLRNGVLIELNGVPGGYGWLFARGDTLNLGVGSWSWKHHKQGKGLVKHYADFLHRYDLGEPVAYRGAAIPCPAAWAQSPVKGRAAWVGDAAALADPFLGEGIGQALCTGLQAGWAIAKGNLSLYIKALRKDIFKEHLHAWLLARLIYARPGLSQSLVVRHPGALELGFGLLRVMSATGVFGVSY